jgi:integrase
MSPTRLQDHSRNYQADLSTAADLINTDAPPAAHSSPMSSRQLGHANITTTLNTYTHLFDHAPNAEAVKQRLEDEFGAIVGGS